MKTKSPLYRLTSCALMAALLCALGPMSVPIGPVPITLATLIIYLSIYLLGAVDSTISVLVYLLLGAVGMPVFSNYQGGLAKLVGPTGGYLVGYLLMTLIAGFLMQKGSRKLIVTIPAFILGTAVLYFFGTAWFVLMMHCEIGYALSVCVVPFVPFDLVKIVLAAGFGKILRDALVKAKLM